MFLLCLGDCLSRCLSSGYCLCRCFEFWFLFVYGF